MWIASKYGFFSVVQFQGDGGDDKILVRARRRSHLQSLRSEFDIDADILDTSDGLHDYPYRFIIPRLEWVSLIMQMGDDIDYPNFKNAVRHSTLNKKGGSSYASFLSRIWQLGRDCFE